MQRLRRLTQRKSELGAYSVGLALESIVPSHRFITIKMNIELIENPQSSHVNYVVEVL